MNEVVNRIEDRLDEPDPFVLQTALNYFYVVYELIDI